MTCDRLGTSAFSGQRRGKDRRAGKRDKDRERERKRKKKRKRKRKRKRKGKRKRKRKETRKRKKRRRRRRKSVNAQKQDLCKILESRTPPGGLDTGRPCFSPFNIIKG